MSDTYGPSSGDSSPSTVLQSSLENRLRAALDVNGSPEYALTWKHWDMQSGVPICALRASGSPKTDHGYTGWPTPQVFDGTNGGRGRPLRYKGNAASEQGNWRDPSKPGSYRGNLKDYVMLIQLLPSPMEVNDVLNPAFPQWLMGYPDWWLNYAGSGTP